MAGRCGWAVDDRRVSAVAGRNGPAGAGRCSPAAAGRGSPAVAGRGSPAAVGRGIGLCRSASGGGLASVAAVGRLNPNGSTVRANSSGVGMRSDGRFGMIRRSYPRVA